MEDGANWQCYNVYIGSDIDRTQGNGNSLGVSAKRKCDGEGTGALNNRRYVDP